ncbi:helix-turn-helix domain-containing protein [Oceanobacillus saliphilus]|uniref:helix-turn-helix domain-containing protein n=1 Tax=Oceanobacillus saliphilus TaxID=2925834 RepID=UPI00201DCEA1|nr:helix-turn-helix domain-containing protein [Oceanobacillus saliphilus]
MVSFLLIISFLLHLTALTAIYKLHQQLDSVKSQDSKEIEGLFEAYLQEIKNENSRLQAQLQTVEDNNSKRLVSEEPANKQEGNSADWTEAYQDLPINVGEAKDTIEASLESRVLQLHREGYPNSDIARRLNCGKTEVEIILKLHNATFA